MSTETIQPLRLDVIEAAQALRISRAQLYKRIRSGDIAAQKDGKRTFVTATELHRYVESLSNPQAAA
jgi:excisionase family DNA binding protein